ncbi:MAG: hypothetical protein K9M84_08760 [Spirochaetia bacterium]|nr:hypothetical protein [Spirochaetia bacterium]MCF7941691.1 hypothetical protein [Spirochaetia bacterium]
MKQSPQFTKIQEQMKPGVITLDGFLGTDTRNLIDILVEDDGTVRRLGLTHAQIADRMEYFRQKGLDGLGEFIHIDSSFDVRVDSVRGVLPSPFGGPGMYQKVNTTVRNLRIGREVTFTDMHIHFVRDHGFYEGKGSAYRIDPEVLIEVLEL